MCIFVFYNTNNHWWWKNYKKFIRNYRYSRVDDMNVRVATLLDLDDICNLNNQLFKLEKENYELIQYAELNNMLVIEECRGMWIGKKLIDNFKEYCKIKNINNIKVVASHKNKDAIDFYHKNSFNGFNLTI